MLHNYTTYRDLIDHAYDIDKKWFEVKGDHLHFNGIDLMSLIEEHGSPIKISYLPKIASQIIQAKDIFQKAMINHEYTSDYTYAYCTKSSHFHFVIEEVLRQWSQLEISSAYDLEIIRSLWITKKITPDIMIICNGYKSEQYVSDIISLRKEGFHNIVVVIDNANELKIIDKLVESGSIKIGIRIATEEEPSSDLYTSRLGISAKEVVRLYEDCIRSNPKFHLMLVHFFMNSKIKDTAYYRSELSRLVEVYADMRQVCDTVTHLDIGGGFPIMNSLEMEYDYGYMADQIIWTIQHICDANAVPSPHVITEFGSYTVGESGAVIYKVIGIKQQNDKEMRYFINNSFITTLPDTRGIGQKFIVLPLNLWDNKYTNVNLWGITCDSDDYYNTDGKGDALILPKIEEGQELYIGIFHTGAYQESIGGFGGIQHCLIPAPKHVIVDRIDETLISKEFSPEQDARGMLHILWY